MVTSYLRALLTPVAVGLDRPFRDIMGYDIDGDS